MLGSVELEVSPGERVEWLVADVSLARALFGGVPAARLLARTRLASDERDIATAPLGSTPTSTWDALLKRVLGKAPEALERVKRLVARHTRAASDEGPLPGADAVVVTLACAVCGPGDADASLAELCATDPRAGLEVELSRTAGAYDARLASPRADRRAAFFEACVRLATRAAAAPLSADRVLEDDRLLRESELGIQLLYPSNAPLLPRDFEPGVPVADRRMAMLERGQLDVVLARDPRELAAAVSRVEKERRGLDTVLADLGKLLANQGELIVAVAFVEPLDLEVAVPPSGSPSWLPSDWSSSGAAAALAEAFERGTLTVPRLRAAIARGGEAALDAIGAEMLDVTGHAFASAAFAEVLARSGRPRDTVRLVTYFALAPDPQLAARALSACVAPELPGVLRQWLEAMLPTDGAPAPQGEDPLTSSAARLTACVASLEPYPHLYRAVRPLLARVSEAPPPVGG